MSAVLKVNTDKMDYTAKEFEIKRAILQGDSLDPFWFCLVLSLLNRRQSGQSINSQENIPIITN